MNTKPSYPCSYPGCTNYTPEGHLCDEHQPRMERTLVTTDPPRSGFPDCFACKGEGHVTASDAGNGLKVEGIPCPVCMFVLAMLRKERAMIADALSDALDGILAMQASVNRIRLGVVGITDEYGLTKPEHLYPKPDPER